MSRYKISDLENLSGVKAHTIRIWEQRYKLLVPLRTETNIRYYDDDQLKKLLNVVSLMNAGHKISTISKYSPEVFNEHIVATANAGGVGIKEEMLISQMISAGLAYDEVQFEKAFSNSILSFGLMSAYQKVFYPMLLKIGLLWATSDLYPTQEHFVSNLIKQKLFTAIDSLNPPSNESQKWLLFLPEDEQHELGLLISNYCLRVKGVKVFYLGQDVPLENLTSMALEIKPTHFLTFSVRSNNVNAINTYFSKVEKDFNNPSVYICCKEDLVEDLTLTANQKAITSFEAFQELMDKV